jgi:hypothetical protein
MDISSLVLYVNFITSIHRVLESRDVYPPGQLASKRLE